MVQSTQSLQQGLAEGVFAREISVGCQVLPVVSLSCVGSMQGWWKEKSG